MQAGVVGQHLKKVTCGWVAVKYAVDVFMPHDEMLVIERFLPVQIVDLNSFFFGGKLVDVWIL